VVSERGLSEEELILAIPDREGLRMADMYRDPELAEEIGGKYQYLKEDGYVPDDAQHWR